MLIIYIKILLIIQVIIQQSLMLYYKNLVDQKFHINDDMKEDAATIIKQIKSAYKSNYGDNYKDSLNQALTSAGYKNLSEYRQRMIKTNSIC